MYVCGPTLDQVCVGWISLKDSLRDQFRFGDASCQFAVEELSCSSGMPCEVCGAGQVHLDSLLALFLIGLLARVAAFVALIFTNRDKQV